MSYIWVIQRQLTQNPELSKFFFYTVSVNIRTLP